MHSQNDSLFQQGIRARNSLWMTFFVMGIASMAWVARIPEIKDHIKVSNGAFGFIFLGATVGAVLGAQIAGRAIHTFGSKPVVNVSTVLMPLGLGLMGIANTAVELFLALMVMGMGYSLTDMCVNTQAVVVEKILDQKWMSSFHGMWSLGSFVTTVFGGVMINFMTPKENLIVVAVASFIAFLPARHYLLPPSLDEHAGEEGEKTEAKIPFFGKSVLPLWAIGFGLITGLIAEGAASDWGAILLRENMNIPKGIYASAFASFALAMITSRFLGDKALEKFGARNTVKYGGMVGGGIWALCFAIAIPLSNYVMWPSLIIVNLGFIAAGLGIGPMFPAFMLAASRIKGIATGVAISRVGLIGIAGFFLGPTLTGVIAQATSLSWAMAYPVGMMIIGGYMSRAISED